MRPQFAALGTLALALAPLGAIPLAISHPTPTTTETTVAETAQAARETGLAMAASEPLSLAPT